MKNWARLTTIAVLVGLVVAIIPAGTYAAGETVAVTTACEGASTITLTVSNIAASGWIAEIIVNGGPAHDTNSSMPLPATTTVWTEALGVAELGADGVFNTGDAIEVRLWDDDGGGWVIAATTNATVPVGCGGGPGPGPAPGAGGGEDAAVMAWRQNATSVDLTEVGAGKMFGTIDLSAGLIHKTDLGRGLIEYGYFSSDQYVPLGWEKIDWTGLHYAVPEENPVLSLDQFLHALWLAGWNDSYVAAPSADEPAVSDASKTVAVPAYGDKAATGSLNAIRGGYLKQTDMGGGLFEVGQWKDGTYRSIGWVLYDAWGNVISYAVPETGAVLTVAQFQQLMESNPSFMP
ncbi:MAG: hypothetical protein JXB47_04090 [Anaerolineae bacterium]|nr:hypothetical protein [Anaerolineae bacterium]